MRTTPTATSQFSSGEQRLIQQKAPSCSFTAEASPRTIFWDSHRILTSRNWPILLRKPPNTRGTHIHFCHRLNRISRGWTQLSSWWEKRFNVPSLPGSNGRTSLSLDFLKARVWRQNSWREMQRVMVVSWHLLAGLSVLPELNSLILATLRARPV